MRIRIRLLPALAFAAPHEIPHLLAMLRNFPYPIQPFWFYISKIPISGDPRMRCSPLICGIIISTPYLGYPWTNNVVETIWKFIASQKSEQGLVEVRQDKFIAGAQPPKRVKHKLMNKLRRISSLVIYIAPG